VGGGAGGDTSGGTGGSGASGSGADAGGKAGSSGGAAGATGSGDAGIVGTFPLPSAVNCQTATRPPSDSWQLIAPPNVVYSAAIAMDPFATGTIWMNARTDSGKGQTGNGGLYKSTDCGSAGSWVWVTDPTKNDPSSANMINGMWSWSMAMDYLTPGTIYLQDNYPSACGDANCPAPQGIAKTTDFGKTWTKILAPKASVPEYVGGKPSGKTGVVPNIASISMDPTNPLHLVLGAHDNCPNAGYPVCEIESVDGGKSWHLIEIDPKSSIGASWAEQSGPTVLNATTWLFTGLFQVPLLTVDNGVSFTNITPSNASYIGVYSSGGGEWPTQPLVPSALGNYYLASRQTPGIITSKDAKSWTEIPNVIPKSLSQAPTYFPQYSDLAYGGGRVFLGDIMTGYVIWAEEPASFSGWSTAVWHILPLPTFPQPYGGQAYFLKYDAVNHIVYASRGNALLSRIYVP
jgi:hypothetical protein